MSGAKFCYDTCNMKSKKLLAWLLAVSVLALAVHLICKYISVIVYKDSHLAVFEISNRFDMNDENSVPQWLTLVSFLTLTVGAFLASRLARTVRERRLWGVISCIALLLSIDDASAFHESVLGLVHLSAFADAPATFTRNAWFIILPFVLIGCVWLFAAAVRTLPKRTTWRLALGGFIFLFGAVMIDSLVNTLPARSFAEQGVMAGIEGWLQLVGLAVLVYAVADYLEQFHGQALTNALKHLKISS